MLTTGNQLRAARALVDMAQGTLAARAGLNINTISSMEKRGEQTLTSGLDKIRAVMDVLEKAGVEFLNHGQPGVRLRQVVSASSTMQEAHQKAFRRGQDDWRNGHFVNPYPESSPYYGLWQQGQDTERETQTE